MVKACCLDLSEVVLRYPLIQAIRKNRLWQGRRRSTYSFPVVLKDGFCSSQVQELPERVLVHDPVISGTLENAGGDPRLLESQT
jgi:hypothetical protein